MGCVLKVCRQSNGEVATAAGTHPGPTRPAAWGTQERLPSGTTPRQRRRGRPFPFCHDRFTSAVAASWNLNGNISTAPDRDRTGWQLHAAPCSTRPRDLRTLNSSWDLLLSLRMLQLGHAGRLLWLCGRSHLLITFPAQLSLVYLLDGELIRACAWHYLHKKRGHHLGRTRASE